MRIIYGFSNCSDRKFSEIFSERRVAEMLTDQKYHGLLIKGLSQNGAEVRCYSGLPVNRAVTARRLIRETDERMLAIRRRIEAASDAPTEEEILFDKLARFDIPIQ